MRIREGGRESASQGCAPGIPASDDGGNSRDRAAKGSWKKRKHIVHTRHAGHRSVSLSARLSLGLSFSLYRRQVCPRFGWIQRCCMHTSQRSTKEHAACTVDWSMAEVDCRCTYNDNDAQACSSVTLLVVRQTRFFAPDCARPTEPCPEEIRSFLSPPSSSPAHSPPT